jgi:predicted CxxxxCH...CXXCH cytochrome family protein
MNATNRHAKPRVLAEPQSRARRVARAAATLLLLITAGCGSGPAPQPGATAAVAGQALSTGLACAGTDAHVTHLNTFACDVCHEANGGRFLFTRVFTFPGGTSTQGGTITRGSGTTPTTCNVACHAPKGSAPRTIAWNTPGPLACTACHDTGVLPATHPAVSANATRGECSACHVSTGHLDGVVQLASHPAAWMDRASAGFHAPEANRGLAACQGCHGATLAGQGAVPGCASCHGQNLPAGVASWDRNCTMCHGGTDSQTGAPPRATWGNAGDALRVGAHTAHGAGGALAPAFDCAVCHVKPVDAFATGHLGAGPAEVRFSGLAVRGAAPSWDRTSGTCSNVYCHGATLAGGTHTAPSWTGAAAEVSCGTCHGAPPPSPHPAAADLRACAACHPETMAADGTVIPPSQGGKHLDGLLQASGGHPAAWTDRASPGFHAFSANRSIASCQTCHGAALDGVGGSATTSCASCHGAAWTTNCTMCHGGTADATGAPPRTTWGNGADATRVGAHARHLAGSASAPAVACGTCHVVPADALSPGHIDGPTAQVTLTGLAAAGGAEPRFDRPSATCATTYCHGGYQGTYTYSVYDWGAGVLTSTSVTYAGSGASPSWTGGAMTCGSCHGAPPAGYWHDPRHGGGGAASACSLCHPGVNAAGTGFADSSRHLDGRLDVTRAFEAACMRCH